MAIFYGFKKFKEFTTLLTMQNDIIIKKINEAENSAASSPLEGSLREKGWLQ